MHVTVHPFRCRTLGTLSWCRNAGPSASQCLLGCSDMVRFQWSGCCWDWMEHVTMAPESCLSYKTQDRDVAACAAVIARWLKALNLEREEVSITAVKISHCDCRLRAAEWGLDLTHWAQWSGFAAWLGHILTEKPAERNISSQNLNILWICEGFGLFIVHLKPRGLTLTALVKLSR